MSRIVLFGATGYQGTLTGQALLARGLSPVLAGRDRRRVRALADELGGVESAYADAMDPDSIKRILDPGDVLVTTVGPFSRLGAHALKAALAARAHYVDSCGESGYYRQLIEHNRGRARTAAPC